MSGKRIIVAYISGGLERDGSRLGAKGILHLLPLQTPYDHPLM